MNDKHEYKPVKTDEIMVKVILDALGDRNEDTVLEWVRDNFECEHRGHEINWQ